MKILLVSVLTFFLILLIASSSFTKAQNTINYLQCTDCFKNSSSVGTQGCANSTFNENSLQVVPGRTNRWMSVSCNTASNLKCAQFFMSTEGQTCSTFYGITSFQCGGCNQWGSKYYKMNCPTDISQSVNVSWSICNDNQCSQGCVPGTNNYNLDTCQPLFTSTAHNNVQVYGKLTEIVPCSTVTVNIYNANSATAANLVGIEQVSQDRCNGYGSFTCSNQPNLPAIVNNQQVLISDYANHGTCSGSVSYASTNTGACRWRSSNVGEVVSCVSSNQYCASLLSVSHFRGRIFANNFNPQCNSCQHMPSFRHHGSPNIWTSITCDSSSQTVTFTHGCPAGCAAGSCAGNSTSYPFDITSATPFHGMTLLNLGVYKCNVIRRQVFNSSSCDASNPANVIEDLYMAEGRCSWGHLAECGTFNIQDATIGECVLNAPERKVDVTSGACDVVSDSVNKFYGANQITTQATCNGQNPNTVCAVIHFWNRHQSMISLIDQRTFVCNSCYYDHRWTANFQTGAFWITCPTSTSVTLTPSIDPTILDCRTSNLNASGASTYNLDQPRDMALNLGVNYNASLVPHLMLAGQTRCYSARLDIWNNTNSAACTGKNLANNGYLFGATLGEAGCDITCADPVRPTANAESSYDVIAHMCHFPHEFPHMNGSWHHHFHPHPECIDHRHVSGICTPLPMEHTMPGPHGSTGTAPTWSVKSSCGQQARCAQLLVFNDSANTNNCAYYTPGESTGIARMHSRLNVVCDQCINDPVHGWAYVACDFFSNNVTLLTNCSANCQDWMRPGTCQSRVNVGWQDCAHNGFGFSFRSLGIESCSVVNSQYWNNTDCSGSPQFSVVAQEDTMSGPLGVTYSCVAHDSTIALPGGSFTYLPCERSNPQYSVNQTQATCINDLHTTGTSSMINCHATRIDQCVSFSLFNSATCTQQWNGLVNVPCNACFKGPDGTYAFAQCGFGNIDPRNRWAYNTSTFGLDAQITLRTGCDSTCNVCTNTIPKETMTTCAAWGGSSTNLWGQFTGLRQCATATYMEWPAHNCQGTPSTITYVQQGVCTKNIGMITCEQQPWLMPKPRGSEATVRFTECSGSGCSGLCSIHTAGSDSCISLAESVFGGNSARMSCTGQVGFCAHMMFFHSDGSWGGKFGQVCNTCNQIPTRPGSNLSSYMKVNCFRNGTVQRLMDCDSTCGTCNTVAFTDAVMNRITFPHGGSLVNLGIFPCNYMNRTVYRGDNCSGAPIISGPVAEDTCNGGATLSCGFYDEESVVRTNCSDPSVPPQVYMSKQCAAWEGGFQSKLSCQHGFSTCANLAVSENAAGTSTTCTHEKFYSAKCGSCLTIGAQIPVRVNCDYDKMTLTLQKCNDMRCSDCEVNSPTLTFNEGSCTLSQNSNNNAIPVSGTFWGFSACTVVKEEFYMNKSASLTCSNDDFVSEVYAAQGVCNGDHRTQCGSFLEGVNAGPIDTNGRTTAMNILECNGDMTCSNNCTKKTSVATGSCVASASYPNQFATRQPPGSASSIYSCPVASTCAHMIIFDRQNTKYTNDTCKRTTNYNGHDFNVACNTCHYTPWAGMIRINCDLVQQTVSVMTGCDGNCHHCNMSAGILQRGLENCTRGTSGGIPWDIVNVGTYTCGIITARGYSDNSCTQLAHSVSFPASTCQFGSIATCDTTGSSNNNNGGGGNNNNGGGGGAAASSGSGNKGGVIAGAIIGVVALVALVALFFKLRGNNSGTGSAQAQYHEEPMNAQYQAFTAGEKPESV